jgi:hypothetical protein
MKYLAPVLIPIIIAFSGCVNGTAERGAALANEKLEAEHSPFRWEAVSAGGGTILHRTLAPLSSGPTKADARLAADIKTALGVDEAKAGRSASVKIKDIKPFESSARLIKEVWIVESAGRSYVYVVWLKLSEGGGADIGLEGPSEI